jgi:N-acetyl-gamma-glutamyl-phosphate reductase
MLKTCVMGASGYTGAELLNILFSHPEFSLEACFVSKQSADANKSIAQVHPALSHISVDKVTPLRQHVKSDLSAVTNGSANSNANNGLVMQPLADEHVEQVGHDHDIIFMALPHEVSHRWAKLLSRTTAVIFDLSGAFRLSQADTFAQYYGFEHAHPELLSNRVYGLAEWHHLQIASAGKLIAVPGCYPTASLLALKPLMANNLLSHQQLPIINAVSGVSGAGRKASLTSSFYEVSLQAYGVLGHRHTPEIEEFAGTPVIFTPHLGAFKRGILATVTGFTRTEVTIDDINSAFQSAYANKPMIRLCEQWPKVDQVAHTPFCDIHWAFDPNKQCVVVCAAIDNLLKGAASQAVQCANIRFGLPESTGLIA